MPDGRRVDCGDGFTRYVSRDGTVVAGENAEAKEIDDAALPTGGSQVSLSMHDATARRVEAKPLQPAPCIRPSLVSDRAPRCRSVTPLRTIPRDSGVGAVVLLVATLGLAAFLFASLHHAVLAPWCGALPMATPPW